MYTEVSFIPSVLYWRFHVFNEKGETQHFPHRNTCFLMTSQCTLRVKPSIHLLSQLLKRSEQYQRQKQKAEEERRQVLATSEALTAHWQKEFQKAQVSVCVRVSVLESRIHPKTAFVLSLMQRTCMCVLVYMYIPALHDLYALRIAYQLCNIPDTHMSYKIYTCMFFRLNSMSWARIFVLLRIASHISPSSSP